MKNFNQARNQAGFSLIELLLVLAIIAALAVAAFIVYPRVQAGRNATYESQVLSSAQAGVKALFTNNNFDKINKASAFNAEIFPKNMNLSSTSIKNQWDGDVDVVPSASDGGAATAAGTPDRYFKITYPNVPTDVCIRLAGAAVQNFGTVLVNGVIVQDNYTQPHVAATMDLDEAKIATNCKAASAVTINFVSN